MPPEVCALTRRGRRRGVQLPDPAGGDLARQQPVHPDAARARARRPASWPPRPGPGRRPLEMASQPIGARTDEDSTNAIEPPSPSSSGHGPGQPHRAEEHRLEGGPPGVVAGGHDPAAGRPADADQRAVQAAELVPGRRPPGARRRPGPRCRRRARPPARRQTGRGRGQRRPRPGPPSTTLAPSATSAVAAASPRPRLPPVTTYTRSRRPRSIGIPLPDRAPPAARCAAQLSRRTQPP